MKTFETEKHNIPEGATHYSDETRSSHFAWKNAKNECQFPYVDCEWGVDMSTSTRDWHPIPQTNIETPEEKEVEWNGECLPPTGALCKVNRDSFVYRVMYSSEYVVVVQNLDNDNTTAHGMDIILDLHKGNYTFSKPESPQQREDRERLENGKSLHTAASKTEEAIAHGIFRLWEMEEKETRNHYCQLAEIIGHKTNYRKESK